MPQVTLSEQVVVQLRRMAVRVSETPQVLAERAIREFLRATVRQAIQQETQVFRTRHTELLQAYEGCYIAMYQGQVVDDDKDQLALLARIDAQYPDMPVLITQVLPEPEETYTVRSPRWEQGL